MKTPVLFFLATMIATPALADESAALKAGAAEPSSRCVVGRASGRARPAPAPQSEAELDALADALLRCPTVDEKVQTEAPVIRPAKPAQTAWRHDEISIPAGNG